MGTAAAVAIAVLATLLAGAAIVLASIANRRWVVITKRLRVSPMANEAAMNATAAHGRRLADQESQLQVQAAALQEHNAAMGQLRAELAELSDQLAAQDARSADLAKSAQSLTEANKTSLRRVAVVRYDAFSDVGGRLSYSTAILDDTATGLVITSLAGKSDIRTYVKAVSGGVGQPALTPEEEQAVLAAIGTTP